MKRFLFVLFFWAGMVNAQPVIEHQIGDDGFVEVPLQFVFPYYGQLFTNSWMFDNGVVGFYSPFNGYTGGQNFFSQPFSADMGGQFNYMIAPLWTDLVNYSGTFTTQGNPQFQRYSWNNISQWGYPDNLNSFSLEITPSGSINVQYDQINISGYPVSVGTTGDLAQGEFEQIFYANSGEPVNTNSISNWNTYTEANTCGMDPLSSPECPGYDTAYYEQQCSFDPLYDSQCPGYDTAYYEQQCSIDPLYDSQCPGYETAYFDQQCSIDPLYNNQCPGYEVAYFDQQCSIDPLYNNQCPGYEVAFILSQQSLIFATNETVIEETLIVSEIEVVITEAESSQDSEAEVTEITPEVILAEATETTVEPNITDDETTEEEKTENTLSGSLLALILNAVQAQANDKPVTTTASAVNDINSNNIVDNNATISENSILTAQDNMLTSLLQDPEISEPAESVNSDTLTTTEINDSSTTLITQSFESLFATSTAIVSQAVSQAADVELSQTVVSTETLTDTDQEYLSELETVVQENANPNLSSTSVAFENSTMQQVLAMGGTITQILNTLVPDFSRFEIKPPSQEEQIVASRIENSLGNMSEEEIESQAESRIGSMDPAAQTIALQLIGYKPGFDQYGGNLVDQSNWYTDRSVYTNNQVPAAARSNLMFGAQDQRHQELMSLQYRR